MFATLSGADALDLQLVAMPAALLARIEAKTHELSEALAAKVRDDKLSGQALASRSGALKASISASVSLDNDGVVATVGSFGDVKYAAIQEYGGRTSAHEILPDKARVLAFVAGGGPRFSAHVNHPGSTLPARDYLSETLAENQDDIVAALGETVAEVWSAP